MKKRTFFIFLPLLILSCSKNPKLDGNVKNTFQKEVNSDSLKIVKLLSNAYKWHESKRETWDDFKFTYSNDSLSGIDMKNLNSCIKELQNTRLFSEKFVSNYRQLGDSLDYVIKMASPKFSANEPNFPFEEADSLNGFQDDADGYWNSLKITDFKLTETNASLNWWLQGKDGSKVADNYYVEFIKENGIWKVSHLMGFNKQYFK